MSTEDVRAPAAGIPAAAADQVKALRRELMRPHHKALLFAIGVVAVATTLNLAGPALLGIAIDQGVKHADQSVITKVALVYLFTAVTSPVLMSWGMRMTAIIGERALADLRSRTFRHVLDLPLATVERVGTGELLSRLTSDVEALSLAVRLAVPIFVTTALLILLTAGALLLISIPLALAAFFFAGPLVWLGARRYLRKAPRLYGNERQRTADAVSTLHEGLDGIDTVRTFGLEGMLRDRMAGRARATVAAYMATTKARNGLRPFITGGQYVSVIGTLAMGAWLVSQGRVGVGEVTAASLYLARLFQPIEQLLEQLDKLQSGRAALSRLASVLALPVAPPAPPDAPSLPERGDVEFRGVRFAYAKGHEVLHGVDLVIRPGERLALVGPTGAGKSTIAKLLAGVHAPDAGEVEIGEVDLARANPATIRDVVVLVTQESHVFRGSVADNVRIVRPDANDADVANALATVHALDRFEELPDGLDTQVGIGGAHLSAGEAQQLGLARVVLADPSIVVLDEATARLDPAGAARVDISLAAALEGRTTVVIAHRLDTASRADRVALVEGGSIVEIGAHTDLLASNGRYADLWRRWAHHGPRVFDE